MEHLTITLPDDLVALIREAVGKGHFGTEDDVVCEALRSWRDRAVAPADDVAELRRMIDEADAETTPPLTDDEVERHFAERFRRAVAASEKRA